MLCNEGKYMYLCFNIHCAHPRYVHVPFIPLHTLICPSLPLFYPLIQLLMFPHSWSFCSVVSLSVQYSHSSMNLDFLDKKCVCLSVCLVCLSVVSRSLRLSVCLSFSLSLSTCFSQFLDPLRTVQVKPKCPTARVLVIYVLAGLAP